MELYDATLALTHEEIAQLIGTSRETITRTLADFRKRNIVELKRRHFDHSQQRRIGAPCRRREFRGLAMLANATDPLCFVSCRRFGEGTCRQLAP